MAYTDFYHPRFADCLTRYGSLKKRIETKNNYILQKPDMGEQLQGDLEGYRSYPLARSFLIIYIVCDDCRRLEQLAERACNRCGEIPEESVIFMAIGPYDDAYKMAKTITEIDF